MAGEIGATTNNNLGVSGAVQLSSIFVCQFIGASGDGDLAGAVLCIDWCLANNVHVSCLCSVAAVKLRCLKDDSKFLLFVLYR